MWVFSATPSHLVPHQNTFFFFFPLVHPFTSVVRCPFEKAQAFAFYLLALERALYVRRTKISLYFGILFCDIIFFFFSQHIFAVFFFLGLVPVLILQRLLLFSFGAFFRVFKLELCSCSEFLSYKLKGVFLEQLSPFSTPTLLDFHFSPS